MSEEMNVNPPDTAIMYAIADQSARKKENLPAKEHGCSHCGSTNLIYDKEIGEAACRDCGLVDEALSEQMISRKQEWRAFTTEESDKRSRVGPGERQSHRVRGSTFNEREKGLTLERMREYRRMKKWNRGSKLLTSEDRNLAHAIAELDRLVDALESVPLYCKDEAAYIYTKALKAKLVRGRSINGIMAASLYASVRMNKIPRTLKEVSAASPLPQKDIARNYRLLLKELDIKMPVPDARDLIIKIATKAGVEQGAQDLAYNILTEAYGRKILDGKDPAGLAASALYIASVHEKEKITQDMLAKAAGVTEVTIRNRYKDLEEKLSEVGMSIEQIIEAYVL